MRVSQINVDKDMKIIDLINQFDQSGVLGAGRVARACNILTDMINDEEMRDTTKLESRKRGNLHVSKQRTHKRTF